MADAASRFRYTLRRETVARPGAAPLPKARQPNVRIRCDRAARAAGLVGEHLPARAANETPARRPRIERFPAAAIVRG